jgi:hypothetical protein
VTTVIYSSLSPSKFKSHPPSTGGGSVADVDRDVDLLDQVRDVVREVADVDADVVGTSYVLLIMTGEGSPFVAYSNCPRLISSESQMTGDGKPLYDRSKVPKSIVRKP